MSRAEVQDVAAARLLPLLRECALAIAPAAADAEYAPTQRVVATDDAAAIDSGWRSTAAHGWRSIASGCRGCAGWRCSSSRRRTACSRRCCRRATACRRSTRRGSVSSSSTRRCPRWARRCRRTGSDSRGWPGPTPKTSAWAAGWREVTNLLPFLHGRVGRRARASSWAAARSRARSTTNWGTWPLGDAQQLYAAADACVVADLVVSIAEKEAGGGVFWVRWSVRPTANLARRRGRFASSVGRVLQPSLRPR